MLTKRSGRARMLVMDIPLQRTRQTEDLKDVRRDSCAPDRMLCVRAEQRRAERELRDLTRDLAELLAAGALGQQFHCAAAKRKVMSEGLR